ncbi:MAG: NAD(P)/FAD-dependent oxidoreductase, partial [Bacteroidota bacterium]|nr:NAD(P)/FAD-dependent oxidoreductase [Bacteroidota bacterium]
IDMDDKHFCGGIRAYYEGVEGLHPENYLELHFLKELVPGYFWIFPLPDGRANVGMGMLSADIKKNRVNLRQEMLKVIAEHPRFKERFKNATLTGKINGWGLPLGSKKRQLSADNLILTGDAASLIDPFTGEGIGNAVISGMVASRIAKAAMEKQDFSTSSLIGYDKVIYQKLWSELQLSYRIQRLTTYPWLFNFVVNRISASRSLQQIFTNMFVDMDLRAQMKNPMFYFRLLFK